MTVQELTAALRVYDPQATVTVYWNGLPGVTVLADIFDVHFRGTLETVLVEIAAPRVVPPHPGPAATAPRGGAPC